MPGLDTSMPNWISLRVHNPIIFVAGSFRTQDVGAKGGLMRIAARLKTTGKWQTQSWRFEKTYFGIKDGKLYGKDNRAKLVLTGLKRRLPRHLVRHIY